jgi:hypothetical protein
MMSLFFLTLIFSCNNNADISESKETGVVASTPSATPAQLIFDRLLGNWKGTSGRSFERWIKNPDGTYQSDAYSIRAKDTSWNEHARIYPENNTWVYDNLVKNQNDGKSVRFISSSISPTSVQFSNPAHDFPTDVCYTIIDDNTVHAFIIGPNSKGGKDTIPFDYIRMKEQ